MKTDPLRLRIAAVASLLAAAALGCAGDDAPTNVDGFSSGYRAARTQTAFTVGPLVISNLDQSFPDGRWHLRNVQLSGPVTGALTGEASVTLNANLDAFLGSGPAWGTMRIITAAGDVWRGSLTGTFRTGAPNGIQLFSQVVLHGPNGHTLRAKCDETLVTSETLTCTGEVLNPHG